MLEDTFTSDGNYSITNDGRVWSHHSDKFLKVHYPKKNGRASVTLNGRTYLLHRLVALYHLSNPAPCMPLAEAQSPLHAPG